MYLKAYRYASLSSSQIRRLREHVNSSSPLGVLEHIRTCKFYAKIEWVS